MKKLLLLVIFIYVCSVVHACDYCNCYIGLNPYYKKNSFGLRYHYLAYIGSDLDNEELQQLRLKASDFKETRTSIELHGQWYPAQKLQLLLSIPYVINTETSKADAETPATSEIRKGTGDAILLAHYQVFNKTASDYKGYSQRLFAGGGIKLPTGEYKLEGDEPLERIHLPGSGSWDYIISASYLGKRKKTGLNMNASYLITTRNSEQFQFANRFNANLTGYYEVKLKSSYLYPSAGVYAEQSAKDRNAGEILYNTGGTILYAHAGVDFYYKKISLNLAAEVPAVQELNNPQPKVQYKIIAGFAVVLN